jgi:Domain of unknown function (DUF4149)
VSKFRGAFRVLLVLWAGSLWSMALIVAPTLFSAQHDRELAGMLAGRLFSMEAYLGVVTAALALLLPGRAKFRWGYTGAGLVAIIQWVIGPRLVEARVHGLAWGLGFGAWHGIAALLYGGACIALLLLVWNDDFR